MTMPAGQMPLPPPPPPRIIENRQNTESEIDKPDARIVALEPMMDIDSSSVCTPSSSENVSDGCVEDAVPGKGSKSRHEKDKMGLGGLVELPSSEESEEQPSHPEFETTCCPDHKAALDDIVKQIYGACDCLEQLQSLQTRARVLLDKALDEIKMFKFIDENENRLAASQALPDIKRVLRIQSIISVMVVLLLFLVYPKSPQLVMYWFGTIQLLLISLSHLAVCSLAFRDA